jgi:prolyl-tRNA editing enzyme YbaK/EbsC (Cys-tRNA(Pro) deacylase)
LSAEPEVIAALRVRLDAAGVDYRIIPHRDVTLHSADDGVAHGMGQLDEMAPTFIVRTENGPLCAIVSGNTRIVWKKIKKQLGLKNVSLASPDEVRQLTGTEVGAVCLVNPGLETLVDERVLAQQEVYGGCGVPGYTLAISPDALVRVTGARVFDFCDLKT